MVLVAPVGYPHGCSINMLLGLSLVNYFGTYEGYLFGSLFCTLAGLIIGTVERYLVGLSLGIPLGYPLEYLNLGYFLSVTLMGAPLWLWFASESVRCQCCFRCPTDFRKPNLLGGRSYLLCPYLCIHYQIYHGFRKVFPADGVDYLGTILYLLDHLL